MSNGTAADWFALAWRDRTDNLMTPFKKATISQGLYTSLYNEYQRTGVDISHLFMVGDRSNDWFVMNWEWAVAVDSDIEDVVFD